MHLLHCLSPYLLPTFLHFGLVSLREWCGGVREGVMDIMQWTLERVFFKLLFLLLLFYFILVVVVFPFLITFFFFFFLIKKFSCIFQLNEKIID
jgi:hypothetical protein